jgi:hypothetical protein
MRLSAYALALARAAEIAGGPSALAAQLGLSRVLVQACLTGSHETPASIFLKVVDYLMAQDPVFLDRLPSAQEPAAPSSDGQNRR